MKNHTGATLELTFPTAWPHGTFVVRCSRCLFEYESELSESCVSEFMAHMVRAMTAQKHYVSDHYGIDDELCSHGIGCIGHE